MNTLSINPRGSWKRAAFCIVVAGVTGSWASAETSASATEPAPPAPIVLSSAIPFDVTVNETKVTLQSLQADFDVMSWQTFVAMNWPVLPNGQPNPAVTIGQHKDNATVWETWKESSQIFLPHGAPPAPWGQAGANLPADLPAKCRKLLANGGRILTQIGKTPGLLTESEQPFKTGPLIDQHGRYARFEILVNETMFDTIVSQKLYNKQAQIGIPPVVFPCGAISPDPSKAGVGSIMVKAAWKILTPAELKGGRFHSRKAVIYTPASINPPVKESYEIATVGLVGLHIVHKTINAPQWVWTTFEHVDNCPTEGAVDAGKAYNFYNPKTPDVPANTPPLPPWDPNVVEPPARRPQVVRKAPIDTPTQALNAAFQAALRKVNPQSVWQYYELVSTQWPTAPAPSCDVKASAPTNLTGTPAPQFLANTTLETYIQGKVPNTSSSCIECHLNATTTKNTFSDFTYLLQRAQ